MVADLNEFKTLLKQKGLRCTEQRQAILNVVLDCKGMHLTSLDIFEKVKELYPNIGIATVYRTLSVLEELDYIYGTTLGDGTLRYEIFSDDDRHMHHHLICTNCGKIIEPEEDMLSNIEKMILDKYNFKVKNHQLKFLGLCKECRE